MRPGTVGRLLTGGAVLVALAGCDNPQAPPTTVVVNTPPDGGPVVLLTVMIAVAFLAVAAAVMCGWSWAQERRARRASEVALREAEDAVLALTGQPISQVRPGLFRAGPSMTWTGERRRALNSEGWTDE